MNNLTSDGRRDRDGMSKLNDSRQTIWTERLESRPVGSGQLDEASVGSQDSTIIISKRNDHNYCNILLGA